MCENMQPQKIGRKGIKVGHKYLQNSKIMEFYGKIVYFLVSDKKIEVWDYIENILLFTILDDH